MDLDILEQVQGNIIGNCLCVLGDSMAMPVASMLKHFRDEFEQHMEDARAERRDLEEAVGRRWPAPSPTGSRFEIDGRQVRAPEGAMLVDAAKHGDVEIPYFCYEPKLGQPVGACRMCLVEIEGIPKLQTVVLDARARRHGRATRPPTASSTRRTRSSSSCSSTTRSTARSATRAASARCRTSPTAGAPGRSRFIEPKRHFKKPLELSPLVAIDRERCILCYRCVRFSQEVAEDYQLVFLERGDHTFVGTHDGRPYVAPVQRQHHRALPGRRAHLDRLPLPRAPVGHRGLGHGLHAVPVAVQRRADRARRRQGRARARARQRGGRRRLALRQGPLRLPGRSARPSASRRRWCATAASCARSRGSARCPRPPRALERAGERTAALVGGEPPTRRASSSSTCCARGSARRTSTRAAGGRLGRRTRARWRAPSCSAQGLRHRPRRRDPRARHRARRGGADPRPARAQGGPPQRRPARGRLARARRRSTRTPRPRCASRRAPPRRRWARWRRRSAARARGSLDDLAAEARASEGFRPGAPPTARAALRPTPCAPRPTSCATPATSSSSGASASPPASAAARRSRRCSRWPARSASTARTSRG